MAPKNVEAELHFVMDNIPKALYNKTDLLELGERMEKVGRAIRLYETLERLGVSFEADQDYEKDALAYQSWLETQSSRAHAVS